MPAPAPGALPQVDSLLSKLGILQERISNTQRLVNLDLDSKRNSLVALGLLVDLVLMMFETHMVFTVGGDVVLITN